ncbi:hypothetical protein ACS0PU_010407 [Formica fusca]
MLERFLTLEHYVHAVSLKCKRSDIPNMLTRDQTEVLKDLVLLMKPVECIIREISGSNYPTCSVIIPIIHCMTRSIEQIQPSTNEGIEFQQRLLASIDEKFKHVEKNMILSIRQYLTHALNGFTSKMLSQLQLLLRKSTKR